MSDRYKGAILSPTAPTVTPQSAGGIYTSSQQLQYQGQGVWPQAVNNPINNSLRFRASASAYLNRTFSTPTNNKIWTWSGWVKRGVLSTNQGLFACWVGAGSTRMWFGFITSTNQITFYGQNGGSTIFELATTPVYRDPSAWYHIVLAIDTTQATASNRAKLYVNGVQVTAFSTSTYASQNTDTAINSANAHYLGSEVTTSTVFDGYMAEVNFIDGVQLTPSSFGTTDAYGIWQPIPYTGSYGTNGFYLPFYNSTTLGTSVTANYLVVAGGGSGQGSGFQYVYGGGGGAGGLLTGTTTLNSAANYTITVGAGGSGVSGTDSPGNNGSNSTAFGLTAIGGSGGRSALGGGGSGGGAGSYGGGNTSGTSGQGNSGGTATAYGATASGGGGGGAGAAGGNGSSGAGGAGGAGTASSISGSSVTYAGGGGGAGSSSGGAGGAGGGGAGAGAAGNGTNGTANTGGGGGAAATTSGGDQTSGAGGSGIVIVSYAGSQRYVGGTVTTSGGNTIHTFTSSGTLTVLGNDYSGNNNTWTLNNISLTPGSTYDSMTDVPTNTNSNTANYCVLNPLALGRAVPPTLSEANLKATVGGSNGDAIVYGTMGVSSGKWYWEVTPTTVDSTYESMGVNDLVLQPNAPSVTGANWLVYQVGGQFQNGTNPAVTGSAYGNSFTSNDVIGIALDMDNGKIFFSKNGVFQNSGNPVTGTNPAASGLSGTKYPVQYFWAANSVRVINFGQRPFAYTPPTGFLPLNTYNLPTPTILAGNQYMDATLYTGTTAYPQAITNAASFKPDFVWAKSRSNAQYNGLFDSVRSGYALYSNTTDAEDTTEQITFNSNGFSTPNKAADFINTNGYTYVGWQWRASNAAGVSNTNGTITSTVSANTTAGFSIVTYTGTGANATVGHGLGVAPKMYIVKNRNSGGTYWGVYHTSIPASQAVYLNVTSAASTNTVLWNSTAPTSSVFSVGTSSDSNESGWTYVAYCFSEVAGYSAFGSYTGNGSSDGPFIYTGFRPRYVLIKRSSAAQSWQLQDTSRNPYNSADNYLEANTSDAEAADVVPALDILSNGFKIRTSNVTWNGSGDTYIYACFAENPFKIARGR